MHLGKGVYWYTCFKFLKKKIKGSKNLFFFFGRMKGGRAGLPLPPPLY